MVHTRVHTSDEFGDLLERKKRKLAIEAMILFGQILDGEVGPLFTFEDMRKAKLLPRQRLVQFLVRKGLLTFDASSGKYSVRENSDFLTDFYDDEEDEELEDG